MPQVGLNCNGNTALRPRAAGGRILLGRIARLTINYLIAISLEQMFWAYSDFFCHSMTVFLYSKQSSFLLKS